MLSGLDVINGNIISTGHARWDRNAALAGRARSPSETVPASFGSRSTFQDTLSRVSKAALFERPIVITNTAYRPGSR
jgi:hypothetical protein